MLHELARRARLSPELHYYVLGSGPTGVSSARALLDHGCEVTLLDVGAQLEPERRARLDALARMDPPSLRERIGELGPAALPANQGLPLKLAFGSAFPYALEEMARLQQHGTRCVESHARGGLSSVWGAAVLPFRDEDVRDWPGGLQALAPHYAAVARWMPLCGGHDDLEAAFPYYGAEPGVLAPSRQAQALQRRMQRRREELRARGYLVGQARLAVRAPEAGAGCRSVGLCLTGCPYGAIFDAAEVLEQMRGRPGFRHLTGLKVERLLEAESHVEIVARRVAGGGLESFRARRALVGLGVISTTKLVLHSRAAVDRPFELRYHPYFLMPLLLAEKAGGVEGEELHALAQLFVEIDDRAISKELVHLQLYTFSRQLESELRARFARLGLLGQALSSMLLGRVAVLQGYFHASEAPPIVVRALRPPDPDAPIELRLDAGDMRPFARKVARLARKLRRDARLTGFFPIPLATRLGRPGEGNHVGAIFPMRRDPGPFESDTLGRLSGTGRVHLVDASVLPSLPATTITYTAMANAHRIATELASADPAASHT